MASIVLAAAGASIGAGFGGTILGLSGAVIGQAAGSIIGTIIDRRIIASFAPNQISEGARLESLRVTSSTEGAVIPNVYGRMKIGGNIFWATDFLEKSTTTTQGGSGKGGGGGEVKTTTYSYSCSFAVGLCEGPISGIGRIWADGKPFDLPGAVWRVYTGTETQLPDSFITAKMGAGSAPAYRGIAYIVFEKLPLEKFGNRIPQLSFEVIRPTLADGSAESLIRAVNLIPGAGEFVYATETITRSSGGTTVPENQNSTFGKADLPASLDNLEQVAPNLESVSLVVSWFGTDLRAGSCLIQPRVETTTKTTSPKSWGVNGVTGTGAHLISQVSGAAAFGGTPADFAVVQAIQGPSGPGQAHHLLPLRDDGCPGREHPAEAYDVEVLNGGARRPAPFPALVSPPGRTLPRCRPPISAHSSPVFASGFSRRANLVVARLPKPFSPHRSCPHGGYAQPGSALYRGEPIPEACHGE